MRWAFLSLPLLGCQGEAVVDAVDAGADTSAETMSSPDSLPSDSWPAGSTVESPGCGTRPGPKMVRLDAASPFCIDTTEVTNAQYDAFLASAKPTPPSYCFTPIYGSSETAVVGPNKPRTNVPWCVAFQYCAWAGKRLCGKIGGGHASFSTYTSATESQWSYACRQGSKNTNYPYGPAEDPSKCVVSGPIADVASKPGCTGESAPFNQIFDLSGNAGEWSDACDRYEGTIDEDGRACAVRGGWTNNDRHDCDQPLASSVMYRAEDLSFRCCVDL